MNLTTIAIAQAAAPHNVERGIELAYEWGKRASEQGATLLAFPESWIPGYPAWVDYCRDAAVWDDAAVREVYAHTVEQSLDITSQHGTRLREIAGELRLTIVLGATERVGNGAARGTLFNSLFVFGADGQLQNHHRKLMPTHGERLVWGIGDTAGLRSVALADGTRVGGLICWEHWMPLARQAMHIEGEDIHIAMWPAVEEMHLIASRHYAFEGRCFVLACGSVMRASELPAGLEAHPGKVTSSDQQILRGGSCVIGPTGVLLTEPAFGEERLIVAELDPALLRGQSMALDVTGHYAREELMWMEKRGGGRRIAD